jgi:hypothetical protein
MAVLVGSGLLAALAASHVSAASFDDGFRTPSRNITCSYSGGALRCDIGTGVHPLPPRPSSCDVDWGQGFELGARGRATIVCAGDTTSRISVPSLRYGRTWRRGGITCVSRSVGLRCRNRSGHGFFMSRERTTRF